MSRPRTSLNPFRVLLAHRNFRLFWLGQTLSLIGTWMQSMAQGWLALELTDNAFLVGLVAAIGSLPILLLSLPAGVLADRRNKLKLVKFAQSLLLVEAALLWWFVWSGNITIGWLLVLAAMSGAVSAVEIPARQSLLVELVGREDLREAIALNSSGFNLARIVGPAIAATVIATLGLAGCFALNALSYLAVLGGLAMVNLPQRPRIVSDVAPWRELVEGVRYARDTHTVALLLRTVTVYAVLGVPYLVLMPVVVRDMLHAGAEQYGVLLSAIGVGGLVGALTLAAVGWRFDRATLFRHISHIWALLLIAFALSRSLPLSWLLLLGAGFAMIVHSAMANAMLQVIVPDVYRGRVMAIYSIIVVGLPNVLGAFVAGAAARVFGADWTIGGAAFAMLVYGALTLKQARPVRTLTDEREAKIA